MHLIKLNEAKKHYCPQIFNLVIEKNDFILVSGENGKGKTTLIELILGFKRPDQGNIDKRKLKIGYVPEMMMLPPLVKASDYLETLSKVKKDLLNEDLIHLFKIPLYKYIYQLSKGNQQKLAILSAFIGKPDLIILDEPLSGLDEDSIKDFICYMKEKINHGLSFLVSTHYPHVFDELVTKRIML